MHKYSLNTVPKSVESNKTETETDKSPKSTDETETDKSSSTHEPETDKSPSTDKPETDKSSSTDEPSTDKPSSTDEPETQPPNKPETKTAETKPTELDWFFNLTDSIKKGTYDPLKWPELFKLPTPPQFVLIEMLELAKKYAEVKVKMKVLEYEKLKQSNLNTNSSG